MTQPTDSELVHRTLSGESQAFGQLVEKYQGLIYGLAYNRVGNTADAQDIAQEVFVRAFRKLRQLEDPGSFGAWIKTITANECKTWLRSLHTTVSLDEAAYSPAYDAAARSAWKYDEFRAEVAQAIEALPEKSREVITLYYLSGMTCEEIADSLGATTSSLQSRLHRARQLLRAEFTGEIEKTLGGRRLPDEFGREVLRRATAFPTRDRVISGYGSDGNGVGNIFLGIPQGPDGKVKLVSISMRSPDACGMVAPYWSEDLGDTERGRITARLSEYRASGMEPVEFILYLDEHDNCKAQGLFRRGRAKVKEDLKVGPAIALSLRSQAPLLVDQRIVELREVGEDGLHYELESDLDTLMVEFSTMAGICVLQEEMFQLGMSVDDGFTTASISRDTEKRVVYLSIDGLGGAPSVLEYTDDPSWVDNLWQRAAGRGWCREIRPDCRKYTIRYHLHGDDITAACTPYEGPIVLPGDSMDDTIPA